MNAEDIARMDEFFATNHFDKDVDWQASAEAAHDPDDEDKRLPVPVPLPVR